MSKENDNNKILFSNLVMMLSSSAMQALGKLVNPASGKTEVNIEAAKITIDMLVMLQDKTKNNLDNDEASMLKDIVSTLQMNFVETKEDLAKKKEEKEDDKPESSNEEKKD